MADVDSFTSKFVLNGVFEMAQIAFADTGSDDGKMLVYSVFLDGEELIAFGDEGLADLLGKISEDNQLWLKCIYTDVNASGLDDFNVSFEVDESGEISGVSNLKVTLDGHTFLLGGYREFADHNGMLGLRYSYRTRSLWHENDDSELVNQ